MTVFHTTVTFCVKRNHWPGIVSRKSEGKPFVNKSQCAFILLVCVLGISLFVYCLQ